MGKERFVGPEIFGLVSFNGEDYTIMVMSYEDYNGKKTWSQAWAQNNRGEVIEIHHLMPGDRGVVQTDNGLEVIEFDRAQA
jgi:hypothetical protein